MATTIQKCNCKNEYQDQKYGQGMRLCNQLGKLKPNGKCKCTVCGAILTDKTVQVESKK